MRKSVVAAAAVLLPLIPSSILAKDLPNEVIYGDDDRTDVSDDRNDGLMVHHARSTALVVSRGDLTRTDATYSRILTENYGQTYQLCRNEPFRKQRTAGFCSSFLVAPNIMVTAGHCIQTRLDCKDAAFVFDFKARRGGKGPEEIENDNIYTCKRIIHTEVDFETKSDFAVIELNRAVRGRDPLPLRSKGQVDRGDELTVIGNPAGLPTKIADGARVRTNKSKSTYFTANLDTYKGNSGSAVFNSATGDVEGVLVRGESDFEFDDNANCYRSKRCSNRGCRGEDVVKARIFAKYVK